MEKLIPPKRSVRRHHLQRMKAKAERVYITFFGIKTMDAAALETHRRRVRMWANDLCKCSCWMHAKDPKHPVPLRERAFLDVSY